MKTRYAFLTLVLIAGPVGAVHWDSSANLFHLTVQGTVGEGVVSPTSKWVKGADFSGADANYLTATGANAHFKIPYSLFAVWQFDTMPNSGTRSVVEGHDTLAVEAQSLYGLEIVFSTNDFGVRLRNAASSGPQVVLPKDTNLHYAWGTINADDDMRLRVDGGTVLEFNTGVADPDFTGTGQVYLNKRLVSSATTEAFDGKIYEVRVWDALLSDALMDEIADPLDDTYKGTAEGTEKMLYFLEPAPTITNVVGDMGGACYNRAMPSAVITGTNFVTDVDLEPVVTVGGNAIDPADVTVDSATEITVDLPVLPPGDYVVTVENFDGQFATAPTDYVSEGVSVTSVTPTSGVPGGGTVVQVTGDCFATAATSTFDATPSTTTTFVTSTRVDITQPALPAGFYDVTVTNADLVTDTLPNAFTVPPPIVLTSIDPTEGTSEGGDVVTLTGDNFVADLALRTEVYFGATQIDPGGVNVLSATALTVTAPALAPGAYDVRVENFDGTMDTLIGAWETHVCSDIAVDNNDQAQFTGLFGPLALALVLGIVVVAVVGSLIGKKYLLWLLILGATLLAPTSWIMEPALAGHECAQAAQNKHTLNLFLPLLVGVGALVGVGLIIARLTR